MLVLYSVLFLGAVFAAPPLPSTVPTLCTITMDSSAKLTLNTTTLLAKRTYTALGTSSTCEASFLMNYSSANTWSVQFPIKQCFDNIPVPWIYLENDTALFACCGFSARYTTQTCSLVDHKGTVSLQNLPSFVPYGGNLATGDVYCYHTVDSSDTITVVSADTWRYEKKSVVGSSSCLTAFTMNVGSNLITFPVSTGSCISSNRPLYGVASFESKTNSLFFHLMTGGNVTYQKQLCPYTSLPTATSSSAPSDEHSREQCCDAGAIAGIVIGFVVAFAAIAGILLWCFPTRRKNSKKKYAAIEPVTSVGLTGSKNLSFPAASQTRNTKNPIASFAQSSTSPPQVVVTSLSQDDGVAISARPLPVLHPLPPIKIDEVEAISTGHAQQVPPRLSPSLPFGATPSCQPSPRQAEITSTMNDKISDNIPPPVKKLSNPLRTFPNVDQQQSPPQLESNDTPQPKEEVSQLQT